MRSILCYAVLCCAVLCNAMPSCAVPPSPWLYCADFKGYPADCVERGAHHDDALQELSGFVDGGVSIKGGAAGGKLVLQDGL